MNTIDLTPLYRSSVGFDRLASLLDSALSSDQTSSGHPPYYIEVLEDNRYAITLAVAGFAKEELDILVENSVLTVRGDKQPEEERKYLYQSIFNRAFERKFNLAEHVEVLDADLTNGLLRINLKKEIPEDMKPKSITISQTQNVLEHNKEEDAKTNQAA